MKLHELFEEHAQRKVLCIFSGGFHPFHKGHASVYKYLTKKFPMADVYVASSNNTVERPFEFKDKQFLAAQAGVPPDKFVQVTSPYKAWEITENYNPETTVLIFAMSTKDKDRLGGKFKKDGSPAYFQPYPGSVNKCKPFAKHGYYIIAPTVKFSVLGKPISSASQIREMYKKANEKKRLKISQELYPASRNVDQISMILDKMLAEPITEGIKISNINDAGWVMPNGKFLSCFNFGSHYKILKEYGMSQYYEAYDKGWVRISLDRQNRAYIETDKRLQDNYDFFEAIAIKLAKKYPRVFLDEGGKFGGTKRLEWDGRNFDAIHQKFTTHYSVNESPDFNYSSFYNRDAELSELSWDIKKLIPSGEAIGIFASEARRGEEQTDFEFAPEKYVVARMGLQIEEENGKIFRATVRQSGINPAWKGTGLGQILYDKAIQYAKKIGCKFFCSDTQRTMEAESAWQKLSKRYPVEKTDKYYLIDLRKV